MQILFSSSFLSRNQAEYLTGILYHTRIRLSRAGKGRRIQAKSNRKKGTAFRSFPFVLRNLRLSHSAVGLPQIDAESSRIGAAVYRYSKPTRGDRKRNGLSVVPFSFCAICGSSYLTSTSAPAATRSALIFSASSLETPSLIAFGAASTRSFASFRPRPVISRTTLITPSF